MGPIRSIAGIILLELASADIAGALSALNKMDVTVFSVEQVDDFTVHLKIYRHDYNSVLKMASSRGDNVKLLKKEGLYWAIQSYLRRPALFAGVLLFLIAAFYLPGRIFFVRIEGNTSIPSRLILERAEECGIRFGAFRSEVRSEKMKNALLAQIPELQWAGVNTAGCVATISVREKSIADESSDPDACVSSIIASRDGIILQCTVLQGTALCRVGQAVKEGQILVSGYTDCGLMIKAVRADAEIIAQTLHEFSVLTPISATKRGEEISAETKYSLLIGKKLIKFYKDSGISDSSCVKMYEEDYLTLPGGFQLPIALVRETTIYHSMQHVVTADADTFSWMETAAENYLQTQMVAGQILSQDSALALQDDYCLFTGKYACLEMIGKVRNEEIIKYDAEDS